VDHGDAGGVQEVQGEIAVAGDVHAIAGDGGETEIGRDRFPVEGETAAGQRAGAEREHVGAGASLGEALAVAGEHFEIGQEVVRPQDRLRAAHVGIAGDHGVGIPGREFHQGRHQLRQQSADAVALRAQPEARIERDLLVAAAPGVDLVGHLAGPFLQFADDERVDVFVRSARVELRIGRFFEDALEGLHDLRALAGRQDADPFERAREGLGAADIGLDQPPVEIERSRKSLENFRRSGFETSAPKLHFVPAALEASSAARTLIGSPIRLIKPKASFWS